VGIYNAVHIQCCVAFEMPTAEGLTPHLIKHGSPMACMSLDRMVATYQRDEVFEGLEVSVWYDDDEDEADEV
jgi:hypothetical protein